MLFPSRMLQMSMRFRLKALSAMAILSTASSTTTSAFGAVRSGLGLASAAGRLLEPIEAKKQALLTLPGSHFWSSDSLPMDPFKKSMNSLFGSEWETSTGAVVLFRGHKHHLPSLRVLEQNAAAESRVTRFKELEQSGGNEDPYPSWAYDVSTLRACVDLLGKEANRPAIGAVLNATFVQGSHSSTNIALASDFFTRIMPLLENSIKGRRAWGGSVDASPRKLHAQRSEWLAAPTHLFNLVCSCSAVVGGGRLGELRARCFWL